MFLLSSLLIAVAAFALVASEMVLSIDRRVTERLLAAKLDETETAMAAKEAAVSKAGADLEEFARKQMLELGFNILVLPSDQDPSELHLNGTLTATMPESYVDKLANSPIVTINHLLPSILRRVRWPEKDIDVILYGTRGEVPIMHQTMKKPLLDAIAPDQMVVGAQVQRKLNLSVGDRVEFMGHTFSVAKIMPERGSSDDATVWIDLQQAQELLGLQNLIHGILALECECSGDRISQVRAEIASILPGTQVIERYSQALTRAETRAKAKLVADEALKVEREAGQKVIEQERVARGKLESQHRATAMTVVPTSLIAATLLVALLAIGNVRQRREEIGIWRALGFRTVHILTIFLGKAAITGLTGGMLGVVATAMCSRFFANTLVTDAIKFDDPIHVRWNTFVSVPLLMLTLAVTASWFAAVIAAKQDAATVLQGE